MSQYAIIEAGSKQYRVEPKTVLDIELMDFQPNQKEITLNQVLFVRDGDKVQIGTPVLADASIVCENLGTVRGPKVIAFKYRRRKNSASINGHRQDYTRLLVKEIVSK
jgi:large subunit ribosomal protein L21